MSENEPRRRWGFLELDENVHRALMRYTFKTNQHPTDVIEKAIIKLLADSEEKDDPKIKLYLYVIGSREKDCDFANLRNLAWRAMRDSSEEQMEIVKDMCEANEQDFETVFNSAKESELEPIAYQDYNGTGAAKAWLAEYMQTGLEYRATDMVTLAQEHGFSKGIIESAKRKLAIKSIHKTDGWYWLR